MITIQILTKNNEKTLEKTLRSLSGIECRVVVGDMGSTDSTLEICSDYGADIVKTEFCWDYSKMRNSIMDSGMNMMVEPWEVVARGHDEISSCDKNSSVMIVDANFASKELRLWKGIGFKNPTYEVLEDEGAQLLGNVALVSKDRPDRREECGEICKRWRESRPTDIEPWYYSAFSSLSLGKADEFMMYGEKYMAMTGKFGPAETQISYMMSKVLASKGDLRRAASLAAKCLAYHPTFSEFWCLLGDLFVRGKEYAKAKSMYENAILIGSRRSSSDDYPVEMDKYNKYPAARIEFMEEMDRRTGIIVRKKD